jgi:hypothetical protein
MGIIWFANHPPIARAPDDPAPHTSSALRAAI